MDNGSMSESADGSAIAHHRRCHVALDVVQLADERGVDTALHHHKFQRRLQADKFEGELRHYIAEWLSDKGDTERELRLSIPTEDAFVIPVAVKHGFDFINAHPGMVMMTLHQRKCRVSLDGFDITLTPSEWEKGPLRPASLNIPTHARSIRPLKKVLMLYNPYAGAKRGQVIAQNAFGMLTEAGIEVHMVRLQRPGHATDICTSMNLEGFDCLAPVGGDGTLHECINGIMQRQDAKHRIVIAPIPAGTGNSFVLELHGVSEWKNSVQRIIRGINVPVDLVQVSETGKESITWSFNSIHWGLGAQVNISAEKMRWLGSAVRYSAAAFFELLFGGKKAASISFVDHTDSKIEYTEEKFCLAIINNIRGAAKGMVIAPQARINDGLVDLLLIRSDATTDLVQLFEGFYRGGSHVNLPFVECRQVRSISIRTTKSHGSGKEEILDIDGELKHCAAFHGEVVAGAIRVIV